MLRKILVANRGEIAIRVIRACRDLNISPIAVYSEADSEALHVRMSDEAVCLGPAASSQSYLNIEAIIAAARKTGAEAIHPGYGFLAENADFAQATSDAGLIFIGPGAEAMRLMGSKTSARRTAVDAGVAIVPGTTEPLKSFAEAQQTARHFGYPVMLKASAGGGGKGMRLVNSAAELRRRLKRRSPKRQQRLAMPSCIWRRQSSSRGTLRFRSSPTRMGRWCIWENASAQFSDVIKK
jgi:acetyl/propionyl-CoA carboxylase alpha subunit